MSTISVEPRSSDAPGTAGWDRHFHAVQFYSDDQFLLRSLSDFAATALTGEAVAVLVVTQPHREGLLRELQQRGVDVTEPLRQDRLVLLDASETVAKITVHGTVDLGRFADVLGSILARAREAAGNSRIAVFGEMVALLWSQGKSQEAIKVEEFWNDLARNHSFELVCAYPLTGFNRDTHIEPFLEVCAQHTEVVPSEAYLGLTDAKDQLRNIAQLQQKAQVLETELAWRKKFVHELSQAGDVDELISMIVRKAIGLIGAEGGVAGIGHPDGLVCRNYFREGKALPFEYCFPPGHGLPGWLLLHKAPYLTNAAESDPHIRHELREMYGIHSALSVPILDRTGEVIAFFEIHNKRDGLGFSIKDQQLLVLVAEISSIAIQAMLAHSREFELRRSEVLFRLFVEALQDYAIFMLDSQGCVCTWNAGAERIKGYKAHEIVGRHFSCFYPAEDVLSGKPSAELEMAVKDGRFEDEGWRVRKDGSMMWANVIITPVRDEAGRVVGFGRVTRDFSDRKKTQEALQKEIAERRNAEHRLCESEKCLRELSLHLLRTQDEERRRIGRDLHDSLGQSLAVLKMKLESLVLAPEMPHQLTTDVVQCAALVEDSIREVRTISYLLYPPMLEEMGLKSAIPWYLEGYAARSGITTTFEVDSELGRLSRDSELVLFRVLQESLTNVCRHSGSSTAHIRLLLEGGEVLLEVKDDGTGVPAGVLDRSGQNCIGASGVGLRGMHERLLQLGGSLELVSTPKGTTVCAKVPVEAPTAVPVPAGTNSG